MSQAYGWLGTSRAAPDGNPGDLCELAVQAVASEPVSAEFPAEISIGSPMDVGAL